MIIKGRDKTTIIEGTPLWRLAFQKILIMRHYQGVTQNFGKMMFYRIIEKTM